MTIELYNGTSIVQAQNKIVVTEKDFLAGKNKYAYGVKFEVQERELTEYGLSSRCTHHDKAIKPNNLIRCKTKSFSELLISLGRCCFFRYPNWFALLQLNCVV